MSKDWADVERDERLRDDLAKFGAVLSSRYLEHVKSGVIVEKSLPTGAAGHELKFSDGSTVQADVLIDCRGYSCQMPFLDEKLQHAVLGEGTPFNLNLFKKTWHPDEPRMAFVGLQRVSGAIAPVAEMQARWVAGVFSGRLPAPPRDAMVREMRTAPEKDDDAHRNRRMKNQASLLHELSAQVRCAPKLFSNMFPKLVAKPMYPAQFRLEGAHADPTALARLHTYFDNPEEAFFSDKSGEEDQFQAQFASL